MMRKLSLTNLLFVITLLMVLCATAFGQSAQPTASSDVAPGVPRLVKFSGMLKDASGKLLANTVGISFSVYAESTGGVALWQETQNIPFSQGRYTVFLGSSKGQGIPAELFASGQPRWLGVRILLPGEEEQPRTLLASVPYALKAVDADTLGGLPASAYVKAESLPATANGTGVGLPTSIITASSGGKLAPPPSSPVTTSGGTVGTIPEFDSSTDIKNSPITDSSGVIGMKNLESIRFADQFPGSDCGAKINAALTDLSGPGEVWVNQNCGLAITSVVNYQANNQTIRFIQDGIWTVTAGTTGKCAFCPGATTGTQLIGSSRAGTILQGGTGVPTQTRMLFHSNGGKIANITLDCNNKYYHAIDGGSLHSNVEISSVIVENCVSNGFNGASDNSDFTISNSWFISNGGDGAWIGGYNPNTFAGNTNMVVVGSHFLNNTADGLDLGGCTNCSAIGNEYIGNGHGETCGGPDGEGVIIYAAKNASATGNTIVGGVAANNGYSGVRIQASDTSNVSNNLVTGMTLLNNGKCGANGGDGARLIFSSGTNVQVNNNRITGNVVQGNSEYGVGLISGATCLAPNYCYGNELTNNTMQGNIKQDFFADNYSWVAIPTFNRNGIGIEGTAAGQYHWIHDSGGNTLNITPLGGKTATFDGYSGDLTIQGVFHASSKSFKIDHPLDPANKYLYHTSVESPDMMNIYNGVIKLNSRGESWVQLPSYFQALNQSFRYQLTPLGRPQPQLYLAKEVSGNRFKIAGGVPWARVSWQVTGIRHDAYAEAHRSPVEVDKPEKERGHYLHPEAFAGSQAHAVQSQ